MSEFENEFDGLDEELEVEVITLLDEEGNETDFTIIDMVQSEGTNYYLVIDAEFADDEEADADILKEFKDENGDPYYGTVESDEEFEKIAALFQGSNDDYDIEM